MKDTILESYCFEFQSPNVTITEHFIGNFDCIWGLTTKREIRICVTTGPMTMN